MFIFAKIFIFFFSVNFSRFHTESIHFNVHSIIIIVFFNFFITVVPLIITIIAATAGRNHFIQYEYL